MTIRQDGPIDFVIAKAGTGGADFEIAAITVMPGYAVNQCGFGPLAGHSKGYPYLTTRRQHISVRGFSQATI